MARVRGTLELRRVARILRDAPPELRKEMRANIRQASKPFVEKVKAETPGSVPARYAGVLGPAIKGNISTALGGSGLGYTIILHAKGKSEDRDLRAVEDGILRHKTFGRAHTKTGKSLWFAQKVRGGMVARSVDELGRQVAREIEEAVDHMAAKIAGG